MIIIELTILIVLYILALRTIVKHNDAIHKHDDKIISLEQSIDETKKATDDLLKACYWTPGKKVK